MTKKPKAQKEMKFYILLVKDIEKYCSKRDKELLNNIEQKIILKRFRDGKNTHTYIACGEHEPYAEDVWQTILRGEDQKQENEK